MAYYDNIVIPAADIPTNAAVYNKTASYEVLPTESGSYFTTTGASGAVTFTLPDTPETGFFVFIMSTTANKITITTQGDNFLYSTSNNSGTHFTSIDQTFIGAHAMVAYMGGNAWISQDYAGFNATE